VSLVLYQEGIIVKRAAMKKEIQLPQIELTMEKVQVIGWLVQIGDRIEIDQPILEIESQKGIVEVPSTQSGIIRNICVAAGDTIGEKALLCVVTDDADEPIGELLAAPQNNTEASSTEKPNRVSVRTADGEATRATPASRKRARELTIDLSTIAGSGPEGRITVEDVEQAARDERKTRTDDNQLIPLTSARIALNAQMETSLAEIPQFHLARHMDVMALVVKRAGITFTHRLVRAVAAALAKHPALRSTINGAAIRVEPVSVAVAINSPNGLFAPAVRNADELPLERIAETVTDFRTRAESGRLRQQEMNDAPFAISNLGMFGVDFFHAFVFSGQTAVLGVGREVNGLAWMTLAVDHRVVDGAEAARFLETLQTEFRNGDAE
jgi:pyruvate dehydrogenase E2 component (dihydrolipoamide acetyltransferase)